MHRKYKYGICSNNSIRYNRLSNKYTKNIMYFDHISPKGELEYNIKINCYKLYDVSVSQKTKKMLNYRCKYYKIDKKNEMEDDMDNKMDNKDEK